MLHSMGYETGVDLQKLIEAGSYIQRQLGRPLPSKVLAASLAQAETCAKKEAEGDTA
jgi:hydroxymethylglutaryl-CoA lyase